MQACQDGFKVISNRHRCQQGTVGASDLLCQERTGGKMSATYCRFAAKDDPNFNLSDELTLLEMIWLEKLQPFGEKGYNLNSNIRQA